MLLGYLVFGWILITWFIFTSSFGAENSCFLFRQGNIALQKSVMS